MVKSGKKGLRRVRPRAYTYIVRPQLSSIKEFFMGRRLYNANDGVTGRDGGPYLDLVEVEQAEKRRAVVEDREPDFDNPPSTAGIQLNSAAQMLYTENVNNLPSQQSRSTVRADERFDALHDDENVPLFATSEIPDDALTNKEADELPDSEGDDENKSASNPHGTATNPTDDAHEEGKDGDVEGNTPGTPEQVTTPSGNVNSPVASEPDPVSNDSGGDGSAARSAQLPSQEPANDNTENPEAGGDLASSEADGDTTPETSASQGDSTIFGHGNK